MLVYICTNFHENILDCIKVIERTRFSSEKFQRAIFRKNAGVVSVLIHTTLIEKNSNGHNSVKYVHGVTFFLFAHCLIVDYICTKCHENILNGIKVIEQTQFL